MNKPNFDFPELDEAEHNALLALAEAGKPWAKKRTQLDAEETVALAPYKKIYEDAKRAKQAARVRAVEEYNASVKAAVLQNDKTPDIEVLARYALILHSENNQFPNFYTFSDSGTLQAPKVPGLRLAAVTVSKKHKEETFYFAWGEKSGKLVGVLGVKPARHPGDSTEAYGEIDGKPVQFLQENYSIKSPVKTWVAALRTVSETEETGGAEVSSKK